MKRIIKSLANLAGWGALALCTTLCSFSTKLGGDSYSIHLKDKLIMQQHVTRDMHAASFSLDPSAYHEELSIRYSHCGQIGNDRTLTIRDEQQKILKEWKYSNTEGVQGNM